MVLSEWNLILAKYENIIFSLCERSGGKYKVANKMGLPNIETRFYQSRL